MIRDSRGAGEPLGVGGRSKSSLKTSLPLILIILLLSFAVYFNTLFIGFFYDDHYQILENHWITDIRYIPQIFSAGAWGFIPGKPSNYYRPLMHIIYMIDYHIFGLKPWGFHLTNMVFNAGVSVLVFLITSALARQSTLNSPSSALAKNNPAIPYLTREEIKESLLSPPFVAAILFAVHPIHTEAVAWVAGVPEVSFAFFYLLAFYFYIRCRDGLGRRRVFYMLSVFAFFISTLCKETALTFPIVLMVYDFAVGSDRDRFIDKATRYSAFLAAAGVYFILRYNALKGNIPLKHHGDLNTYELIINIFPLFGKYLEKLLLPTNLNLIYVFHPVRSIAEPGVSLSLIASSAFVIVSLASLKKNRAAFFSFSFLVIPLLPVLYIPGLDEHVFSERYLYLPTVGFALLASLVAGRMATRPRAAKVLAIALALTVGIYSVETIRRNSIWKNDLDLWSDTVRKSPDSADAQNELGLAYMSRGMADKAIGHLRVALSLNPHDRQKSARTSNNLGLAYASIGKLDEAIECYETALSLNPSSTEARNNLGSVYARKGWTDKAVEQFQAALSLNPNLASIRYNLGLAYKEKGFIDLAQEQIETALTLDPGYAEAHNSLGIIYGRKGLMDKAIEEFRSARRLDPSNPAYGRNLQKAYEIANRPK